MMTAEDKEHVILGEAAINLIFRQAEVSVDALIRELDAMAAGDGGSDRLAAIHAARRWLHDYRQPGSLSRQGSPWFAPAQGPQRDKEESGPADGIVLSRTSDSTGSD